MFLSNVTAIRLIYGERVTNTREKKKKREGITRQRKRKEKNRTETKRKEKKRKGKEKKRKRKKTHGITCVRNDRAVCTIGRSGPLPREDRNVSQQRK